MYECRCPNDNKKLAELARPPLGELNYIYYCRCGEVTPVQISLDTLDLGIVAFVKCPCGLEKASVIGHLARIKRRNCSIIAEF